MNNRINRSRFNWLTVSIAWLCLLLFTLVGIIGETIRVLLWWAGLIIHRDDTARRTQVLFYQEFMRNSWDDLRALFKKGIKPLTH